MKRDGFSGGMLIAGALVGILVMAMHPTAHQLTAERMIRLNALIHGVALVSVPVVFLGLLGAARRLGTSNLTNAGLVAWGFGAVAVASAAVASGFVATSVVKDAEPSVRHMLLDYTYWLNQGFAKVDVVATSIAILCFSAAILRGGLLSRPLGIYGVLAGSILPVALIAGYLRLNVTGFGIVVLAQGIWLFSMGVLLCREEAPRQEED